MTIYANHVSYVAKAGNWHVVLESLFRIGGKESGKMYAEMLVDFTTSKNFHLAFFYDCVAPAI